MSQAIKFIPPRVPLTDPRTGIISREWYLLFVAIYERIGGSIAPDENDIVLNTQPLIGFEEFKHQVLRFIDDASCSTQIYQEPAKEDYLETQVRSLSEELKAALSRIEALEQGVVL